MTLPHLPTWTPGQLLCFSGLDGPTCYINGLVARTRPGNAIRIEAPATLDLCLPAMEPEATLSSDVVISATTQVVVLDAHHLLISGPCQILTPPEDLPASLRVHHMAGRDANPPRTLIGSATHWTPSLIESPLEEAIRARLCWLAAQAPRPPSSRSSATDTAWSKALSMLKSQVYSAEGRFHRGWTTPDRWPHRNLWLWDSAFHAIGWRHIDPALAREFLQAVFDTQKANGFIPHMATPFETSAVTQPPILALAAGLIDETAPDDNWLATIYPSLARYLEWDFAHRDRDGNGLCEWAVDPENPNNRSDESGMDNSTRFDAATLLDAVDLNSYLAHECEWMTRFAIRLGRPASEVKRWQDRHSQLITLINRHLWNDASGFYFDRDIATDRQTGIWSGPGFLPLLCGAADAHRAQRLAAHLIPGAGGRFDTPVPISSIPPDSPGYTRDMWRGPMWISLNWLVIQGLTRTAKRETREEPATATLLSQLAAHLHHRTLSEIERWHAHLGTFFEFYDDAGRTPPPELPRKGRNAPDESPYHQVIYDFGWSAALYIDLCSTPLPLTKDLVASPADLQLSPSN